MIENLARLPSIRVIAVTCVGVRMYRLRYSVFVTDLKIVFRLVYTIFHFLPVCVCLWSNILKMSQSGRNTPSR